MNNQDFTATISVDKTPKETFDAINNVRGWWSEEIEDLTMAYCEASHQRGSRIDTEVIPAQSSAPRKSTVASFWVGKNGQAFL